MAATLYLEMKRCIKVGNLKAFREAITVVKEILRRGDLPDFLNKLASHKESSSQRNLLHIAAANACQEDDARFFNALLDLGFILYEEDKDGNYAAFLIADIRGDGVFIEAFNALVRAGFDITRVSSLPK